MISNNQCIGIYMEKPHMTICMTLEFKYVEGLRAKIDTQNVIYKQCITLVYKNKRELYALV